MIGGARQIECTINGLGERAGNTALEEVVMALRTRRGYYNLDVRHRYHADRGGVQDGVADYRLCRAAEQGRGGANAFAHASGIHQDGMLKSRETYEIMRAEDVGWTATKIVLGKLSGRNAFKQRLRSWASSWNRKRK
jgi:2-isopropylmalate synthase